MGTSDIWLVGIPAYLALALSVALFVLDIKRHRKSLRLHIDGVMVWNQGAQSLVLFHLTFVNPSSIGRTIDTLSVRAPDGITHKEAVPLRNENLKSVYYLLPNDEQSPTFSIDEVQYGAIDIPPNQSRHIILGVYLQWDKQIQQPPHFLYNVPQRYYVFAHDIDGKQLARKFVGLSISQLDHDDIHLIHQFVKAKYQ